MNSKTVLEVRELIKQRKELIKERNKWKHFALLLWNNMDLCNQEEQCSKKSGDPMCPCDYYKKLVLNK